MHAKVARLNLEQLARVGEGDPSLSPRLQLSHRGQSNTVKRKSLTAQAIQAPSPRLRSFNQPEKQVQMVVEDNGNKEIIYELRQQVENIWHEYAAARKRNLRLTDEKEALQSQIHWLKKAVRQQEYDKQALEKQLQQYKAAADHCQVEDL